MSYPYPVSVLGICYDVKSSFLRGAAMAPPIIKEALFSESTNSYSEDGTNVLESEVIQYESDIFPKDYLNISDYAKKILEGKRRLLSIGGDHSITYPLVARHHKQYGSFDILHIDAHSDLYDSFEGDRWSHACPFARIMEEKLADRLIQVGIRCLTPHLREQADRFSVELLEMKDYSLNQIPKLHNPIYLSLDMDALDPAYAPGVSHHEPGGFTSRQILNIIQSINVPILGADLVEYNPTRDVGNITAALAAKIAKEILSKMIKS